MRRIAVSFVTVILLAVNSAGAAGLVGTQLSLQTLAQSTPMSAPIYTSFPNVVTVSETEVEYPDVGSLYNGTTPPPGFANSLVDVAINVGETTLDFDFANAGSGRYASGFQNTYVFTFTDTNGLELTSASPDTSINSLGLTANRLSVQGNQLFVNVQGLGYSPSTRARINLTSVPEPATLGLIASSVAVLLRRRRAELRKFVQ